MTSNASPDPVSESASHDSDAAPTPRLATPATETSEESVDQERNAVGDEPDIGGLTPPDSAQ